MVQHRRLGVAPAVGEPDAVKGAACKELQMRSLAKGAMRSEKPGGATSGGGLRQNSQCGAEKNKIVK